MAVTLAFTTLGASGATTPKVQHTNTAIPKAQALLKALLKRPTKIPVTVKITKPIPKNKIKAGNRETGLVWRRS